MLLLTSATLNWIACSAFVWKFIMRDNNTGIILGQTPTIGTLKPVDPFLTCMSACVRIQHLLSTYRTAT